MSIKSLIQNIKNEVASWFSKIPQHLKPLLDNALVITTAIKNALSSPIADIVTAIVPGTWDDELKAVILKYLTDIIPALTIMEECKGADTLEEMLQCWISHVKELPKDVQDAVLHKLGALLVAYQDGKQLEQNMYDLYFQGIYSANK